MIHYIVAVWLGPRRVQPVNNPYAYLKHQLYFLKNSKSIDKATFVVNHYDVELEKRIKPLIDSFGAKVDIIYRKNSGCSYSAWQEGILQNLEYDYHFLTEDDGKPTNDNFLEPFLNEMKNNTIFVSDQPYSLGAGLLSGNFAKKMYSERNVLFKLLDSTSYQDCEWNQEHFLDYLKEVGEVTNIKNCSHWYQWANPLPGWLWGAPPRFGRLAIMTSKFNLGSPYWAEEQKNFPLAPISAWQTHHKLI